MATYAVLAVALYVCIGITLAVRFGMAPYTSRDWHHPVPVFLWPLTLLVGLWDMYMYRKLDRQRSRWD